LGCLGCERLFVTPWPDRLELVADRALSFHQWE
jgi:hypothetical protein